LLKIFKEAGGSPEGTPSEESSHPDNIDAVIIYCVTLLKILWRPEVLPKGLLRRNPLTPTTLMQ
jgi:hypothetical protein